MQMRTVPLILAWLSLIHAVAPCAVMAYDPPIGIPDPKFGIDDQRPTRPKNWVTEKPGYYYINYQSGTDSRNTYGTPRHPRRTIPIPIPAGSYIEVHGTYRHLIGGATPILGKGNGKPWVANRSGPVWIVGRDTRSRPDFTTLLVVTGSHVYFDNVRISQSGVFQVGTAIPGHPADHIVLRNSEAQGVPSSKLSALVGAGGTSTGPVNHVVFYNNRLHDHGDVNAKFDADAHITALGRNASHIWFLDNVMFNASGSGAQVGGAYGGHETCHHIYYGRNKIYNTRQSGLWVKHATDVIFSQNDIRNIVDTRLLYTESASPSSGIGFQYAPQRLWILHNTISNSSYGIFGGSTKEGSWQIFAVGNVINNIHRPGKLPYAKGAWAEAAIMMQGGTTRYIVNNTLYNVDAGINGPSVGTIYHLENNIVSKVTEPAGNHVFIEDAGAAAKSTLHHSILHQPGDNERIRWGSSVVSTVEAVQRSNRNTDACSNADPLLASPSNADFHLQSASPAVDRGMVSTVYRTFQELYGLDIAMDAGRNRRPAGKNWDVGAFEYIPRSSP